MKKNTNSYLNNKKRLGDMWGKKNFFFLKPFRMLSCKATNKMNSIKLQAPPRRSKRQDPFHPWQSTHTYTQTEQGQPAYKQGRRNTLKCSKDHEWTNTLVWKSRESQWQGASVLTSSSPQMTPCTFIYLIREADRPLLKRTMAGVWKHPLGGAGL